MGITSLIILFMVLTCFIVSIKTPVGGILGYLIIYTVYSPTAWYGAQLEQVLYRPSFVAGVVLIASCLINYNKLLWKVSRREIEIYAFIITIFLISYGFGIGVEEENWVYLEKMLKLTLFLFFLFRSIYELKHVKMIIWALIAGGIFLSFQAHKIGSYQDGRLNSIGGADFSEANALAVFLSICVVFLGIKILKAPLWKKIAFIIPIPIMLNTIIMTQSRGVFIGIFIAFIFILWKSSLTIKKEIIICVFLALMLFVTLTHDKYWERMGTIEDQTMLIRQQDDFWQGDEQLSRIDFWRASLLIFKDHPMGIGVKNFENLVPLYDSRNKGMDAHNTYVLCYTELGIIGIFLFVLIIIEAFLQLKKIEKISKKDKDRFEIQMVSFAFFSALVIFFTGPALTHSYLYSEFTWILLALPVCLESSLMFLNYKKETNYDMGVENI